MIQVSPAQDLAVRFPNVFRLRQNTTQLRNKGSLCEDTATLMSIGARRLEEKPPLQMPVMLLVLVYCTFGARF